VKRSLYASISVHLRRFQFRFDQKYETGVGGKGSWVKKYLKLIDHSTRGPRCDVTPIFGDVQAFSDLIDDLIEICAEIEFDVVAAIDALGFILGTGIALRVKKPLVTIRKGGKLPVEVERVRFVDYTGEEKFLEVRLDVLRSSNRVLVVDEWIETGAQVQAATELIERFGAIVAGVVAINMDENETTKELGERYPILTLSRDL
jgi:adenine phosphoribosyltransferase